MKAGQNIGLLFPITALPVFWIEHTNQLAKRPNVFSANKDVRITN
jgi:hypothetical protein